MGTDLATDASLIAMATRSCLELAEKLGLSSVALPAFGTGVGGFGVGECATIMVKELDIFATEATQLTRVVFVLFGEEAYRAFYEGAEDVLGR